MKISHQRLPMPIAEMGPWFFWAAPEAVGLSAVDAEAIRTGAATPEQQQRASFCGQAAMNALIRAATNEPFGSKPS